MSMSAPPSAARGLLGQLLKTMESTTLLRPSGEVVRVVGTVVEASGIVVQLGSICWIDIEPGLSISAEVVGFRDGRITLVPFGDLAGVRPGSIVRVREEQFRVPVGPGVLGRVLDGFGRPIDDRGPLVAAQRVVGATPPSPLDRARIRESLSTGVRALDALVTTGRGQRLGIFAGSGVGKSTLLAMIARHASSEVNVIALIGERGREVREFIDEQLGPEGLARSVVIVATSDQPALLRIKAAEVATSIAEAFRDEGKHVLFLMDSVTRLAMAQREIGLGAGEPPALRGYPPSVFSYLPKLLERTGSADPGTITGFYTVLVEGDDMNEPIADTVRSILDGHIVLSRSLAERNHYPAIDVLASVSRVMPGIVSPEHLAWAGAVRAALADYAGARDLIEVGAYAPGSSPAIDVAIASRDSLETFLCQTPDEVSTVATAGAALAGLGLPTPAGSSDSGAEGRPRSHR
jgi:flagellum-specific ATP synthase